jgi:hypothetical protein
VAILVGAMMMSQATEIDWNNMSEAIPAFLTMVTMPFTFSITNGIVLGLVTAMLFYVTTGQLFVDMRKTFGGGAAAAAAAANNVDDALSALELSERSALLPGGENQRRSVSAMVVNPHQPSSPSTTGASAGAGAGGTIRYTANGGSSDSPSVSMGYAGHHSLNGHDFLVAGTGGGASGAPERLSFIDDEPFVRSPSLILMKRDAEAVRKARGMSVSQQEGFVSNSAGGGNGAADGR